MTDLTEDQYSRRSFLRLTGAGFVILSTGTGVTLASEKTLSERAKAYIADKQNLNIDTLKILNEGLATWTTLNKRYYSAKVYDTEDHQSYAVLLDGDADPVDRANLLEREKQAYYEKYGSLDKDLFDYLESSDEGEKLSIGIWLDGVDYAAAHDAVIDQFDDIGSLPNTDKAKEQFSQEVKTRTSRVTNAFAEEVRSYPDVTILEVHQMSPSVRIKASREAIREIEKRDNIKRIFRIEGDADIVPELDSAAKTHFTWDERNNTYNANGFPVGQGETKPDDTSNVSLADSNWTGTGESSHSTRVMEAMASADDDLPGSAHDADVYHADEILSKFDEKIGWFKDNSVSAVNFSWRVGERNREMKYWDFQFDQEIYSRFLNFTMSAGNNEDTDDDGKDEKVDVTTPGLGFNTITVGNLDDQNDGYWSNDEISSGSSYENPYSRHADPDIDDFPHSKPEVSAVGTSITFPSGSTGNGTSYASPGVAGLITLLVKFSEMYGTINFRMYPEVVKPIVMACARNNEGGTFNKLGTGAIDAESAEEIIKNEWFKWDTYSESNDTQTYNIDIEEGENVRLALHWLSNPDAYQNLFSDNKNAQSDIDLDLEVLDSNGDFVAISAEYDRGYEWVTFTADKTDQYEIEVSNYRWEADESSRYMGLAWHRA